MLDARSRKVGKQSLRLEKCQTMSCEYCGMEIEKGERFVSVGSYPSWWRILGARTVGPSYFGKIYHEACYLESLRKQGLKQKERGLEESSEPRRPKEEESSIESSRKRLIR